MHQPPHLADLGQCRGSAKLLHQNRGEIDMERLWDRGQVAPAAHRLDPRDDRHRNIRLSALFDKAEVDLVVEEHLRDDVVGTRVDLLLEHGDVELKVGRLAVLLGVAGDPDAEVGLLRILQSRVEVVSCIEVNDLADELM